MNESSELTSNLIEIALKTNINDEDKDKYWEIIGEIHRRGSEVEFNAAKILADSTDPKKREVSADILGQLDWSGKKFHDECVTILIRLLNDNTVDVIASAAFSLGHRNDVRAIPSLVLLTENPSAWIRHGVTFGLSGFEDDSATKALIKLSRDADTDVRNWATFGLASQCDRNTQELRNALFERITDKEYEIRGEALIGLATRNDTRVHDALISELEGEFNGNWAIEAARLLSNPIFEDTLKRLKSRLPDSTEPRFLQDVEEAISACAQRKT